MQDSENTCLPWRGKKERKAVRQVYKYLTVSSLVAPPNSLLAIILKEMLHYLFSVLVIPHSP